MISIIGSGKVGSAIAFLCISNSLDDVLLVNRTKNKAIGPAMKRAQKAGALFKYKTGGGHTGSEIVKFAQQGKYDVIVIGARGIGAAKEAFLGSTSNYVIHKAKIPVLVVK